ncbi:MAG: sensor histidine kinase [Gemmatimonadales bacterium]
MTTTRRWLAGFGIWTVLAILSASQSVVRLELANRPIDWNWVIQSNLVSWYSCAIFTPLFFLAARRFPIDGRAWPRHLPLHLALCAVASALKYLIEWFTMVEVLGFQLQSLGRMLTSGFISENIAFWCMTAAIHAIEFQHRARQREVLSARLEARLSEAQLNALTVRLHPHFLFNTLQGVSTLVHRDPTAADAMLGHLSTLLRRTLHGRPRHEVTLEEELEILEHYLAIAQARFGDRVTIERVIAPDTLGGLVPCLSLQPLLENAFEHGIARRAASGRVVITSRRNGPELEVSIRDDGYGPTAGTVQDGVGLGTTRGRLTELYGPRASLRVAAHPDGGTVATMVVPFHETPVLATEATA